MDRGDAYALIRFAVDARHTHTAKTERGDFRAIGAELTEGDLQFRNHSSMLWDRLPYNLPRCGKGELINALNSPKEKMSR